MELIVAIVVIMLGAIAFAVMLKYKEKQKVKTREKEMERRFKSTLNLLSEISDGELSQMLIDLVMTEIIYDNLVVKCGKAEADSRCGSEEYGCKNHTEKMILIEEIKKEKQKRETF